MLKPLRLSRSMSEGSENSSGTQEGIERVALSKGLECFFPGPREITLDLDGGNLLNDRTMAVLADTPYQVDSTLETTSLHGNKHLWIRLTREVSDLERLALHAMLGSDPMREILGFKRYAECAEQISAVFETPAEARRVRNWRKGVIAETKVDPFGGSRQYAPLSLDDDIPF